MWVLIISFIAYNCIHTQTIEFNSLDKCKKALEQVKIDYADKLPYVNGSCIQK